MPVDSNDVELSRLRWGAAIVGGSIVAVIVALLTVTSLLKIKDPVNATDLVALMGTVTTFLGLAVGILFGVNAGGSARAGSAEAASQMASVAGKATDAAQAAADSAQRASETAARAIDISHVALRSLRPPEPRAAGESISDGVEDLTGDPGDLHTRMVLSTAHTVEGFARGVVHIANPAAAQRLFAERVLGVADAEASAGVSRSTNQARITEYLNLLGLGFFDEHGIPTRYCAAGVTWATCKAYCDLNGVASTPQSQLAILRSVLGDIGSHYFKPSAGCQSIMDDAKARGTFVAAGQPPQPGWLVFFNWEGAAHAQHIGFVEGTNANVLRTVEFNTTVTAGPNQGNGGAVAKKCRVMKFVLGYARTY